MAFPPGRCHGACHQENGDFTNRNGGLASRNGGLTNTNDNFYQLKWWFNQQKHGLTWQNFGNEIWLAWKSSVNGGWFQQAMSDDQR